MTTQSLELPHTLVIDDWETPATKYPLVKYGSVEINRVKYYRNFYHMEGVNGYIFFKVTKPIQITQLKINNRVWMVDDPLHWYGMKTLSEHSKSNVLVGGLGLGLLVHALVENINVTSIDVVEISSDVKNLVSRFLPNSIKWIVYKDDIYTFPITKLYDTIILDLWVGSGSRNMFYEMLSAYTYFKTKCPSANVYIWGYGESWLNPAVDDNIRKKLLNGRRL